MANPDSSSMNLAIEVACDNLIGFVIVACNGNPDKARAVIADMILAYKPADTVELTLISQIVGFGLASMDSLRRSMADPDMPDARVLRYRTSAASLSRSAEQCRVALNTLRAAANPAERPAAPAKPQMPPADATDAQKEKARALLNRLDQLHKDWGLNPIPGPAAPAEPTPRHIPSGYG